MKSGRNSLVGTGLERVRGNSGNERKGSIYCVCMWGKSATKAAKLHVATGCLTYANSTCSLVY